MVIVGIGIIRTVEPLLAAGADGGNGVNIDKQCRTSLPDVFAIDDCAMHENSFADGAVLRIESVQNANEEAGVVAKTITGTPTEFHAVSWFWSNQYDLPLQTIGLSMGYDHAVIRGRPEKRSFSVVYLKSGRIIALDCVNAIKDYVQGRALLMKPVRVSPDQLADTSIRLKEFEMELPDRVSPELPIKLQ